LIAHDVFGNPVCIARHPSWLSHCCAENGIGLAVCATALLAPLGHGKAARITIFPKTGGCSIMSTIHRFGIAAAAVVACTLAAPAGAALIMHKDLSHDTALALAEGAIASCKARGYGTSAVVVDRDGETLVAMRGDGASPHTMENARRKAYTAMTFKQPTAEYAKKLLDPTSVAHQQITLPNVIAIDGGVPIKVGNDIIGGIGVSGSPGVDTECVNASLDKNKDQLQ
jgi:uncharacterized protein GlcG (DUF336 family)